MTRGQTHLFNKGCTLEVPQVKQEINVSRLIQYLYDGEVAL